VRPNLSVSKIVCDMNMYSNSFASLLLHTFTAYLHVFLLHTYLHVFESVQVQ